MRVFPFLFILTLASGGVARAQTQLAPPTKSYGACADMKEEAKRRVCFDNLLKDAAGDELTPLPPPVAPEPLPPPRRVPAPETKAPPAPAAPPPVAEPIAGPPVAPPPPPEKTKGGSAPAPKTPIPPQRPPQRPPEAKPASAPPEAQPPEPNTPPAAASPRLPAPADPAPPVAAPPRSEPPPSAPAEPTGATLVPAEEMVRTPAKFRGKYVEMRRMRCFYAEKDDFRCTVTTLDAAVIVVAPSVRPAAARRTIEQACADMRAAAVSPACQVTIRFTPAGVGEDRVGGLARRAVVAAPEVEIAPE
jgi:hypothetical protein